jgi:hypothetical protein
MEIFIPPGHAVLGDGGVIPGKGPEGQAEEEESGDPEEKFLDPTPTHHPAASLYSSSISSLDLTSRSLFCSRRVSVSGTRLI